MAEVRPIRVELGNRGYDVVVGRGVLDWTADLLGGARRVAIVTQDAVVQYAEAVRDAVAGTGVEVHVITVPEGEAAKELHTVGDLYRRLAELPLLRDDLLIAVGGGVVGDLTGFLAATWNRGIDYLQVPTTLLAQVDAAIGGKTGINLPEGKNLVGAFHQPRAVVIDVNVLATLPERELRAGLGEVVKYGLIRDRAILQLTETRDPFEDRAVLTELVERSVAVKAEVVAADERESGERAHLNFGHTFGHAVETLTGYGRYLHGEAVSIGMCVALRLGAEPALRGRVENVLTRLGLPIRVEPLDRDEVWRVMARDKKARDGVRFVVVRDLAEVEVVTPSREEVDRAIDAVTTD